MKKSGIKILEETIGTGEEIIRNDRYQIATKIFLNKGELITTPEHYSSLDENGYYIVKEKYCRQRFMAGIFYALEGMRVGSYRKVKISPHLAFRDKGFSNGRVPPDSAIVVEIKVIEKVTT